MKRILLTLTALTMITACSQKQKQDWGLAKEAPDEFLVVSRAPLTLPPDYDLRPVNENMMADHNAVKYQGLSSDEKSLMKKIDNQSSEALPADDELLIDESNNEIEKELENIKQEAPQVDEDANVSDTQNFEE